MTRAEEGGVGRRNAERGGGRLEEGKRARGNKKKEGRRDHDWMEGRVYERSNRTHFPFIIIIIIIWAKVGGDGK